MMKQSMTQQLSVKQDKLDQFLGYEFITWQKSTI